MGVRDALFGPRRDSQDVQDYLQLSAAAPKPWTPEGRQLVRVERRLGDRVCNQLDAERRR